MQNANLDELREQIRTALATRQITQAQFAEQIGVHQASVCRFLNGVGDARRKTLLKIQAWLAEQPADVSFFAEQRRSLASERNSSNAAKEKAKALQAWLDFQMAFIATGTAFPAPALRPARELNLYFTGVKQGEENA